jgi:hypothetical protein
MNLDLTFRLDSDGLKSSYSVNRPLCRSPNIWVGPSLLEGGWGSETQRSIKILVGISRDFPDFQKKEIATFFSNLVNDGIGGRSLL